VGKRTLLRFDVFTPEPGVNLVDESLKEFDERAGLTHAAAELFFPIGRAQVLAGIDPVVADMRKQRSERRELVLVCVAAIVNQDVERTKLFRHALEEFRVTLIADRDMGARRLKRLAVGIDVDSDDPGIWAEVAPPDFQRSAARHADF
jgi:hypothetical protein